jgi:hypothetical protein
MIGAGRPAIGCWPLAIGEIHSSDPLCHDGRYGELEVYVSSKSEG